MELEISEKNDLVLKRVYNPIILQTSNGETLSISMRDGGFECYYKKSKEDKHGVNIWLQQGEVLTREP